MRRFLLSGSVAVAAAVILGACSNEHAMPTGIQAINGINSLTLAQNGCVAEGTPGHPTFTEVNTRVNILINALFTGTHKQSTSTMWENLKTDKLYSNPLQNHIDNLTKWTLGKLGEGSLLIPTTITTGPDAGLTATTGSVRLLDLVFTCVNLTPTSVPQPPSGFDAAFALVDAVTGDQQFNTSFKDAAGFVKGGSLDAKTMLVIVRQPPEVQVNTPFPKLSRVMDIALAGGKLKPGSKLTVLVCPSPSFTDDDAISHRGIIAHQKTPFTAGDPIGQGVEYLQAGEGGVLPCPETADVGAAWRQEKGFFRQRAMQLASLANKAWSYIGPKPLYAGHAAIGGGIEFFSPVVIVDTYIPTQVVVDPVATTTYGSAVVVNATLKVTSTAPANWAGTPAMDWVGKPVTQLTGIPAITTPLPITAVVDDANGSAHASQTQTVAIDADSKAQFTFTHENAGNAHNAQLTFPQTLNLPASAPVFVGSGDNDNAFVVNPAPLDIYPAAASRVYGDPNPTLTGDVQGEKYTEDGTISAQYSTDATIESEITTTERMYQTKVQPGSVASTGTTLLSNYVFNIAAHTNTFTINRRTLHGTVAPATRVYGEANPAFTPWTHGSTTASGTVTNPVTFDDGLTIVYSTAAVSTTPITGAAIVATLTGAKAPNYIKDIPDGALTITPRVLTGGPTPVDVFAIYGDAVPASFANELAATVGTALVSGDGASASFTTSASQGSGVGAYPITLALSGDAAGNYNVGGVASGMLHITPRALTGTIDAKSKIKGQENPPLTGNVGNTYAPDGFEVKFFTTATTESDVGSYPITVNLSLAGGQNYTWDANGDAKLAVTELVLDQEQSQEGTGSTIGLGGTNNQRLAQVVTAGISGKLAQVALPVACTSGIGSTVSVRIMNVVEGAPGETVLSSTSVAASSLPSVANGVFQTFTLDAPATITSGTQFAIVFEVSDPANGACSIVPGPSGSSYESGVGYYMSIPENTPWSPLNPVTDLPFRTYVIPTP
ncbi:MAG TPA: MBG domain-containing protein [Gemmatimonadaceae bacterium]|nr:MBG domain-containing protein [Gemmatimonadaceae bacterium]